MKDKDIENKDSYVCPYLWQKCHRERCMAWTVISETKAGCQFVWKAIPPKTN